MTSQKKCQVSSWRHDKPATCPLNNFTSTRGVRIRNAILLQVAHLTMSRLDWLSFQGHGWIRSISGNWEKSTLNQNSSLETTFKENSILGAHVSPPAECYKTPFWRIRTQQDYCYSISNFLISLWELKATSPEFVQVGSSKQIYPAVIPGCLAVIYLLNQCLTQMKI